MPTVVANRYARALADVVGTEGDVRKVLAELEECTATFRQSVELQEVCDTPAIGMPQKLAVLKTIAGRMGVSTVTSNFLQVLMSHYRLPLLEEVTEAFRNFAYARLGIVRVHISSAFPLSAVERQLLQSRFNQLTHLQSELQFHLNGELIGGVVAQIGSTVYDGSIRGSLERIQEGLLQQ